MSYLTVIRNKIKIFFSSVFYSDTFKAKTFRGGLWLGSAAGTEQVFRFIRNMILTRLLAPEAFGVMAIILAISSLFDGLTQVGIGQSIIQNPEAASKKYLNGAWWLSFIRGAGIYIISFIAAPFIADFYDNQELVILMRVAFISMFFNALVSSKAYIAQKQMDFKKWVIINQGGAIIGIISAVILALVIKDVWALVIGFTVEMAARCLLSYILCPFRPGLEFDKVHLSTLFKYTRGMFGLPILTLIFLQGDVFVIGKVLPMADLGFYSMAVNLARAPFNLINNIVVQLFSPVFSKFQKDTIKINELISTTTMIILYVSTPVIIFSIFFSRQLLTLIYGPLYSGVSMPFSIILCAEIFKMIGLPIVIFYMMSGRPELHRLFTAVRAFILIALIYAGVKTFGLVGASIVVLIAIIISYIFQMQRIHKITSLDIIKYSAVFLKAVLFSIIVIILSLPMSMIFGRDSFITIIIGGIGCLIAIGLGMRFIINDIKKFI